MNISPQQPVLVTGATGYLASWIIKLLLEQGCTVRGSVRHKAKTDRYAHLEAIAAQSDGTFEVFEADLLDEGAFDEAAKGCGLVMHTASPFSLSGIKDAQKQLIDPALQGTRNVLGAASRSGSVSRVVLTSSVVAIYGDNQDIQDTEEGVFDETQWNTSSSVSHQPYAYSKTLAEQEAWKLADAQDQWSLVVLNPAFILGPSLTQRVDSTSISTILDFLKGKLSTGVPELYQGVVDVRDVALAHLKAGFQPEAAGRHILCREAMPFLEIAKTIESEFPDKYKLPSGNVPKWMAYLAAPFLGLSFKYISNNVGYPIKLSNQKSKDALGMSYRPFSETMRDQVQQLEADGLV